MTQATHDCDARHPTNPCDLCKQRELYADLFVAVSEAGEAVTPPGSKLPNFVCGHCIPTHSPAIDMEDDRTQIWEVGSDGWLGPIECMDCGESIEVEVDRYTIHRITDNSCSRYDPSVLAESPTVEGAKSLASALSGNAYGVCIVDSAHGGIVDWGLGFGASVELPDEITEVIPDMDERVRAMHQAHDPRGCGCSDCTDDGRTE